MIGLFTAAPSVTIPVGTDGVRTTGYAVAGVGIADYVYDAAVDAAYVAANPRTSFVSANGRGFRLAGERFVATQFGVPLDGTTDATAAINDALVDVSARGAAQQKRLDLTFPAGIYMTDGMVAKPWVHMVMTGAHFKKLNNGSSQPTNSLLRTINVAVGGTPYGVFTNMKFTGGMFDSNGKTCPNHIVNLMYLEDCEFDGPSVQHSAGNVTWAFCIGGRRITGRLGDVLGGTALYQDGYHIYHGQDITLRLGVCFGGDDAIAVGGDPAHYLLAEYPDPIRRVTLYAGPAHTATASTCKIYIQTGSPDTEDWEVTDVSIYGLNGVGGGACSSGISIRDYNGPAVGSHRLRNIHVDAGSVKIGDTSSTTHAYCALWIESAKNVSVRVQSLEQVLSPSAPNTHRLVVGTRAEGATIEIGDNSGVPNGGIELEDCVDTLIKGRIRGSSTQSVGLLRLTDCLSTVVQVELLDCKSGLHCIHAISGIVGNADCSLRILPGSKFSHAAGASAGYALSLDAASALNYVSILGADLKDAYAKLSSNLTSITGYNLRDNQGLRTRIGGTATVGAGATSVTVTHGLDVTCINQAQINIHPAGPAGSSTDLYVTSVTATQFNIVSTPAPGGSGRLVGWEADTGQKPAL